MPCRTEEFPEIAVGPHMWVAFDSLVCGYASQVVGVLQPTGSTTAHFGRHSTCRHLINQLCAIHRGAVLRVSKGYQDSPFHPTRKAKHYGCIDISTGRPRKCA